MRKNPVPNGWIVARCDRCGYQFIAPNERLKSLSLARHYELRHPNAKAPGPKARHSEDIESFPHIPSKLSGKSGDDGEAGGDDPETTHRGPAEGTGGPR